EERGDGKGISLATAPLAERGDAHEHRLPSRRPRRFDRRGHAYDDAAGYERICDRHELFSRLLRNAFRTRCLWPPVRPQAWVVRPYPRCFERRIGFANPIRVAVGVLAHVRTRALRQFAVRDRILEQMFDLRPLGGRAFTPDLPRPT